MTILNATVVTKFYKSRSTMIEYLTKTLGLAPSHDMNKEAQAEFYAIAESIGKTQGTAKKDWSLLLKEAGITPLKKDGTAPRNNATGATKDNEKTAGEANPYAPLVAWLRATASSINKNGKSGASAEIFGLLTDAMICDAEA